MNIVIKVNGKNSLEAVADEIYRICDTDNPLAKTSVTTLGKFAVDQLDALADGFATILKDATIEVLRDGTPAYRLTGESLANRMLITAHPDRYFVENLQPKERKVKESKSTDLTNVLAGLSVLAE